VRDEIDTQVKRLQRHPSLAMWAANNENEAALRNNWYGTDVDFEQYKVDFIKLYIDTVKVDVEALDPSRSCISSSPTNGIESELEGWVAEDPYSNLYGDIHHYDYKSDSWDWRVFNIRRTRYSSEYGYQSFPYYESLAQITDSISEWTWESAALEHRQHHPGGQVEIRDLISSHLPFPADYNSTEAFPHMLYMAQIMQSTGVKTETEFYRRMMDKLDESDGTGHNMGALYWQLNDIWQGASWASIEISGRWKMLAYYARRAMSPILPSPYKDSEGNIVIELISDSPETLEGEMTVRIFKLDSLVPVETTATPVSASFLTSKEVYRLSAQSLEEIGCGSSSSSVCVVIADLPGASSNFLFLHYPIDKASLMNPNLSVSDIAAIDEKTISFVLNSDAVAPFVFINLREQAHGKFDDNGFIMVESSRTIKYASRDPISLTDFTQQLDIVSLYDVTAVAK
jgi:beta-mannosidase